MPQQLTFEEIENMTAPMVTTFIKDINTQTHVEFDSTIGGITYHLIWDKSSKDGLFHLTSTIPSV